MDLLRIFTKIVCGFFITVGIYSTYSFLTSSIHDEYSSNIHRVQHDLESIATSLITYKLDNHLYPNEEEGLEILYANNGKEYLPAKLKDPWGIEYEYLENNQNPIVFSNGSVDMYGVNMFIWVSRDSKAAKE